MRIKGTVNLEFLLSNFDFQKSREQIKQGFVLEGGSGSAKTYDIIQFLLLYCQHYKNHNKDILIFRDTLSELKKTVYKDFKKILLMYGFYNEAHDILSPPIHYKLFGNVIYFSGLDVMGAHGERHDLIWGNEGVGKNGSQGIQKDAFKQLNQRCNEAFILDYNPVVTDHWIYDDIIPREDTKFFKSTLLTNPFLPRGQRDEILKYEPTEYNIQHGTADDYLWNVYGLGLRSAPEGLIFQHVTWIDKFPDNIEQVYYGLDFGYTQSPTALTKIGVVGDKLYADCLYYGPTPSQNELIPIVRQFCPDQRIMADSADPGTISAMRHAGLQVYGVNKFPNSIKFGISLLKKYKLHFVDRPHVRKEQSNYKYREINGIRLDEPIDDHNHFFDSIRYSAISNLRRQ